MIYENVESAAKLFGISPSTVKKYYGMFENEGYRYKRDNQGRVIFDNHEIEMFKDLIFLKNQPGMSVPKAVKEIAQREGITDVTDVPDTNTDISVLLSKIEGLEKIMLHQYEQSKAEIAATRMEMAKHLPKPQEEERLDRMTDMITRRRIESDLRKEALKAWMKKPDSERLIRRNFLWKEEDTNKRDLFIEEYVSERFEEKIKEEYF